MSSMFCTQMIKILLRFVAKPLVTNNSALGYGASQKRVWALKALKISISYENQIF